MNRFTSILFAALALVLLHSAPASAATGAATPPIADYWDGFVEHWSGMLKKQNGVVMFVLGLGAVSLFIITRGKWKK